MEPALTSWEDQRPFIVHWNTRLEIDQYRADLDGLHQWWKAPVRARVQQRLDAARAKWAILHKEMARRAPQVARCLIGQEWKNHLGTTHRHRHSPGSARSCTSQAAQAVSEAALARVLVATPDGWPRALGFDTITAADVPEVAALLTPEHVAAHVREMQSYWENVAAQP